MPHPISILLLTPTSPLQPEQGWDIRVHHLVRQMVRRGHELTVVSYEALDGTSTSRPIDGVEFIPVAGQSAGPAPRWRKLLSLASTRSYQGRYRGSGEMDHALRRVVGERGFDLVQVEGAELALALQRPIGPLMVVDEHNIEYELRGRMAAQQRAPAKKIFQSIEAAKLKREETTLWRNADAVLVPSSRECLIVAEHAPATPVRAIANGVDVEGFRPSGVRPRAAEIVFVGLMNYGPNVDAAQFMVRDILPKIQRQHPGAHFTIVGKNPGPEVVRLAGPAVEVTGRVPDVRPYLERASVVVVPLRVGGGTRLKVLEALSMAKPLVSTSLGAEGIEVQDGTHLHLADDPQTFADRVSRVLHDPSACTEIGLRGRGLVVERYSWDAIGGQLDELYRELLSARRPPDSTAS